MSRSTTTIYSVLPSGAPATLTGSQAVLMTRAPLRLGCTVVSLAGSYSRCQISPSNSTEDGKSDVLAMALPSMYGYFAACAQS